MNPFEQRLAIAESVGAICTKWADMPQNVSTAFLENNSPDYLNDLNAMHEVEIKMTDAEFFRYALHLESMAKVLGPTGRWIADNQRIQYSATAAQRAEAYLRTIGKWKD